MSIQLYFDRNAIIKRNKQIVGSDKYRLSATATVEANLQQLSPETLQKIQGVFEGDFVLYVDADTTINVGDIVIVKETDEEFSVTNVNRGDMFGISYFKEVYLKKKSE